MHLLTYVDEVLVQCVVCRPYDKAPRVPVAGASTVSTLNEELHVGLPFVNDITAFARDGRFLEIFPLDSREIEDSPGSMGRLP